jgi:hypothetical protein
MIFIRCFSVMLSAAFLAAPVASAASSPLRARAIEEEGAPAAGIKFVANRGNEKRNNNRALAILHPTSQNSVTAFQMFGDPFDDSVIKEIHSDFLERRRNLLADDAGAKGKKRGQRVLKGGAKGGAKGGGQWLFELDDDYAAFQVVNGVIEKSEENDDDSFCADNKCFSSGAGIIDGPNELELILVDSNPDNLELKLYCPDFSDLISVSIVSCTEYFEDDNTVDPGTCELRFEYSGPQVLIETYYVSSGQALVAEIVVTCAPMI